MKTVIASLLFILPCLTLSAYAQETATPGQAEQFDMMAETAKLRAARVIGGNSQKVVMQVGSIQIREGDLKTAMYTAQDSATLSGIQVELNGDESDEEIREMANKIHRAYQNYRNGSMRTYSGPKKLLIDILPSDAEDIRHQYEKDLGKLLERYLKENFGDTLLEDIEISIKGATQKVRENLANTKAPVADKKQTILQAARSDISDLADAAGTDIKLRGGSGRIKLVFTAFDLQLTDDLRTKLEAETGGKEYRQLRLVARLKLGHANLVGGFLATKSLVCEAGIRDWKDDKKPVRLALGEKEKYVGCRYEMSY